MVDENVVIMLSSGEQMSVNSDMLLKSISRWGLPIFDLPLLKNMMSDENSGAKTRLASSIVDEKSSRMERAYAFLALHPEIEKVIILDVAKNIEMINYPLDNIEHDKLYFADTTEFFFENLTKNGETLSREIIDFMLENPTLQRLESSIILGERQMVQLFLGVVTQCILGWKRQNDFENAVVPLQIENQIINFAAYRFFPKQLQHGRKVSTITGFKQDITSSWFRNY